MQDEDLSDYEIALMKPLHDFKNVINRKMQEPPAAANKFVVQKFI